MGVPGRAGMTTIAPPLTEAAFMAQVTQYAELRGWKWYHPRPARTLDGWRTAGSGPLAKGWPDLVLIRATLGQPRRLIFAEVKTDTGRMSPEQLDATLAFDDLRATDGLHGVEVYVWRPKFWDRIEETLR